MNKPTKRWGWANFERLSQDIRYAIRQLLRSPGFSVITVMTLALGIGATTAIFTLVYDVMLRPLPFAEADQLVTMEEIAAEWSNIDPTLYPELKDGLVSGASPHLSTKMVAVCAQCGTAQFSIDESELRWFRKEQSYRAQ